MARQKKGPFHPLRIEAVPCDMEEAREHLEAFVAAFIRSDRRDRAKHLLFRLAAKTPDELRNLWTMLDERYTSPPQAFRLPASLPGEGIYFDGGERAWRLSLEDAKVASNYLVRDAIWSGVAGNYAAYLSHEGENWICYRPNSPKKS